MCDKISPFFSFSNYFVVMCLFENSEYDVNVTIVILYVGSGCGSAQETLDRLLRQHGSQCVTQLR